MHDFIFLKLRYNKQSLFIKFPITSRCKDRDKKSVIGFIKIRSVRLNVLKYFT